MRWHTHGKLYVLSRLDNFNSNVVKYQKGISLNEQYPSANVSQHSSVSLRLFTKSELTESFMTSVGGTMY